MKSLIKSRSYLQGETIILALLFLLAVPDKIPSIYRFILDIVLFAGTLYISWQFLKMRSLTRFIPSVIAAGFYNPYTTLFQKVENTFVQDIFTALLFFLIALSINKNR